MDGVDEPCSPTPPTGQHQHQKRTFDALQKPDIFTCSRQAMPAKPSFMIHTGDISHLSKEKEFDDAEQIIKEVGVPVFYVPGEHDLLDEDNGKTYLARYGAGTRGAGYYSFDRDGIHFSGLVNVVDLKAGGLGNLGNEQLA